MSRIKIFVGHTGSGKSELAINLAISSALSNHKVSLIDLDIVNPYFCIRDIKENLKRKYNIDVFSSLSEYRNAELMVLSKDIKEALINDNSIIIIDVGGDKEGAKVLKQYINLIKKYTYDINFVINTLRSDTRSLDQITYYIKTIEKISSLKVSNLICNTNLIDETTIDDIILGERLVESVSKELKIPFINTVIERKCEKNKNFINKDALIIDRFIKMPWK
ncbi:Septum formation inhibitor-activating ATPase [uncultured Clostridium sp.]|uniref:nucleotide-binding protein n=1 Tax=uncultured Clostridium sp. TaxID=59620 RepID=UPI000822F826|nr:ATP-binding protein [uncultured Clostridium sp.]SCK04256.1 Septum formation inhibitor-activating ATPase [uncultured Clostridium sp.]